MSAEIKKRLSRWMLGSEQPTPYCLGLYHPAQDDIAQKALISEEEE